MKQMSRAIELARTQSIPNLRNWSRNERILVAVSLTEEGRELVTWALTDGSQYGDTVTIIHVVEPCQPLATRMQVAKWERQKKDMLNILSNVVTYCRKHYDVPPLSIIVQVVQSKSIGDAIVEEARTLEATRVILGKHKSRRLDLTPKRMPSLGRLCVQNLEAYCDVVIVRNGKVLIRRPGRAKLRRSLQALLLTNKTQESHEFEEADNHGAFSQLDDEIHLSSSSEKSSTFSSEPFSHCSSATSTTNPSQDSSFSSGISSWGSETSPNSVLRTSTHHGKPSFNGEQIERGFTRSATFTEQHKGDTGSGLRARCRCSPNSLESVPELPKLPAEAESDRKYQNEAARVECSQPQSEDRKDEPKGEALVECSQPQSEDSKDESKGEEQRAIVCLNPPESEDDRKEGEELGAPAFYARTAELEDSYDEQGEEKEGALLEAGRNLLQWANLYMKDKEREEGAIVTVAAAFAPPLFARTCSALRYNLSEEGLQSLSTDVNMELPEVRRFAFEELRAATNDFAQRNVVGVGGASTVYKAQLRDGGCVAVKRLVDNMAGEKEFMMEMMMLICSLNHPHLVTMIGFCAEGANRLIAYKLLTRGSLERNLHNATKSRKLNWEQRQKVAFGASRGLAYLHSFSPKPIIHRDIKTANILLSDDFEAQVSDFGLARWLSECDATDEQVSCAGTFGYLAPETLMYGGFNERTDVFAFGVVLLELISGRRPMEERLPDPQQSLVLWARTLQQTGRTHCLVDRRLKDINAQQFKRMMYAAFLCVQVSPDDRPTMSRVVSLLDPNCNYSPALLQPDISPPPFISMPELGGSRRLSPSAIPSIPAG